VIEEGALWRNGVLVTSRRVPKAGHLVVRRGTKARRISERRVESGVGERT